MLDVTPDARDVEVPASRRVVEFPERQTTVRLPVRFVNGLAVVRVIVGRAGYDFLLDSGCRRDRDRSVRRRPAGLRALRPADRLDAGAFPESTTIVPQMTIGGLRMRNVVTRVVQIPFHLDNRTRVAGLLGFDFFADTVVHIDLDKSLAEAIAPDRFHAPPDASSVIVALDDKTPAVRARAGTASGRVVLDTGANRTVFESAFAERGDFSPERFATTMHVRGMGGFANAEPTRVPTFELGGIYTRQATADVSNADLGTEDVDGIIGTDLLRSYDLWFNYRLSTVFLRRAAVNGRTGPSGRRWTSGAGRWRASSRRTTRRSPP